MKFRKRPVVVFTNLERPRVGLSEDEVSLVQRPRTGLLVMAAATGLAPVYKSDEEKHDD